MKYVKEWKDGSGTVELSYAEAKDLVSRCYSKDVADEILSHPQTVNCRFSYLTISEN